MENIRQRIARIAKEKYGMTINAFEKTCGLPPTTLAKARTSTTLNSNTIEKILLSHPEIDAYYLITGCERPANVEDLDKRVRTIERMLNIR